MKKESPSTAHFCTRCPPTEFALAHNTDSDSTHPTHTLARTRADQFSDRVLKCDVILHFARTFFQDQSGDVTMNSVTP